MRLRSVSLALGLLIGLVIGWSPDVSYTTSSSLFTHPPGAIPGRGVSSTTQTDPIDLGWLSSAKESTVVVVTPRGHGSGVVVRWEGGQAYILTAKHVIDRLPLGSDEITLMWASGDTDFQRVGTLLKMDECADMALVTCFDPLGMMKPVPLSSGFCDLSWQYVIAIGYPCDTYPPSVTIGEFDTHVQDECKDFFLHSASIWFGNSGGPLFNLKGELIGINVMISGYNGHAASDRGISVAIYDILEFIR